MSELAAFFLWVEEFRHAPSHDMGEQLTEYVMRMVDLRERDQQRCLDAIDQLMREQPPPAVAMDEATCRLVEMITGQSSPLDASAILAAQRHCLGALATGDEEALVRAYRSVVPDSRGTEPIQIPDIIRLRDMGTTSSGRTKSRRVTESQLAILHDAYQAQAQGAGLEIDEAFEILGPSNPASLDGPGGETTLLCHCTRDKSKLASILEEGLQVRGVGGTLGKAIYFADDLRKSIGYYTPTHLRGRQYTIVFLAEVVLGRVHTTHRPVRGPPPGHDSVHASTGRGKQDIPVHFTDGTSSVIPRPEPATLDAKVKTSFSLNEYTVYTSDRVRLRFMLMLGRASGRGEVARVKRARVEQPAQPISLQVIQRMNDYRRAVVQRRQWLAKQHGVDSPEWHRITRVLKDLDDRESLVLFED